MTSVTQSSNSSFGISGRSILCLGGCLSLLHFNVIAINVVDGFSIVNHLGPFSKQRTLSCTTTPPSIRRHPSKLFGWVEVNGEWEWEEDDPDFVPPDSSLLTATATSNNDSTSIGGATPQLPSGKFRPKQSLGQNYLNDPNTVTKIIKAFHNDATHGGKKDDSELTKIVELGPGMGALTNQLVATYGTDIMQCIEIDPRAIEILQERYPNLRIYHEDVLQIDYPELARNGHGTSGEEGEEDDDDNDKNNIEQPLVVIGNLPYYITSQILFALADASHTGSVDTATVTMQWEVAQRMVAPTCCKDYGILSVVFQTYADVKCHFKIPNTVFYPKPKVDSALVGLHFLGPTKLQRRLAGVDPVDFRNVVTTAFRQRRKTVRNSLKKLEGISLEQLDSTEPLPLPSSVQEILRNDGDGTYDESDIQFARTQELPADWAKKRPEELSPGQFVELTRLLYGTKLDTPWKNKVWRKLKHGT